MECGGWNALEWTVMGRNGLKWNGMAWNGTEWNSLEWILIWIEWISPAEFDPNSIFQAFFGGGPGGGFNFASSGEKSQTLWPLTNIASNTGFRNAYIHPSLGSKAPCLYGKRLSRGPGHPPPRVTLGAPTKRAFTWQITTCLGKEGHPGGRDTRLTRWGNLGAGPSFLHVNTHWLG